MKKVILVAAVGVLALVSSSCKKDYTCSCTETASGIISGSSTTDTLLIDMSKSDAETSCTGLDENVSTPVQTYSKTCALK